MVRLETFAAVVSSRTREPGLQVSRRTQAPPSLAMSHLAGFGGADYRCVPLLNPWRRMIFSRLE
jgi:hypothetical protein